MDKANLVYKSRILAVDDEPAILVGLKKQLEARGYQVKTVSGGREALVELANEMPDLIILDLMMPDLDGFEVIRELRLRLLNPVPVIVLSARGEEQQKVEALDLGADDYLTKPFGADELLARIRVALRHSRLSDSPLVSRSPTELVGNDYLKINLANHQVFKEGKEIRLTPKQYDLLKLLAQNPGRLITYRYLLQNVWGPEYGDETQYVHVYIRHLRQKLEPNPNEPRIILTEPGLGYRFMLPGDSDSSL